MIKKMPRFFVMIFLTGVWLFCFSDTGYCQTPEEPIAPELSLQSGVMCETIEAFQPKNIGTIFSIARGKVVCYTAFDVVSKEMVIFHDWYKKDQLSTRRKLTLKPPKWSAFTEIQLREADKGPWRVDVIDENGNTIQTLRFSITE